MLETQIITFLFTFYLPGFSHDTYHFCKHENKLFFFTTLTSFFIYFFVFVKGRQADLYINFVCVYLRSQPLNLFQPFEIITNMYL